MPDGSKKGLLSRARGVVFGPPKDVHDAHTFHSISLVAMLAWVGLGADGLSSSAYGPAEAFKELLKRDDHTSLAVGLALGTALTVFIISYGYSRIIEQFPSGGGGYVVATKLLGSKWGVVSGSALLVDYVLTITTSIAAGGDAIFDQVKREWLGQKPLLDAAGHLTGFALPDGGTLRLVEVGSWLDPEQRLKVGIEIAMIVVLTILNIRGVKESVTAILPIFAIFLVTHVVLLLFAIGGHVGDIGTVAAATTANYRSTIGSLGAFGTVALFVRAYSLGGGTYTGIEAVSNGVSIMREPRVRTAKRTMVLMATSLSIMAGGVLLSYLLVNARPDETGRTLNGIVFDSISSGWHIGGWQAGAWFTTVGVLSEAFLLFIAAQAGFVDGPRVMANMAVDSWLPHRFAALSERLSMQNGVLLMSGTSIAALLYTHGDVSKLIVMYSINVFLTFSMSNLGMSRFWISGRKEHKDWYRHLPIHLVGLVLCVTILIVTCVEKFADGGWLTLVITGILVLVCMYIQKHYGKVVGAIRRLDVELPDPLDDPKLEAMYRGDEPREASSPQLVTIDAKKPIALLFVGGYGGLGRHALMTLLRMFPGHFKGVVFCSVAIIDSGNFKGVSEVEELEQRTMQALEKYKKFARTLNLAAEGVFATGIEVAVEAERLAQELILKYPRGLFVAGQLLFDQDTTFNRILHNETAFLIQRRLQHSGIPMIVLPVRLTLSETKPRLSAPSLTAQRSA
jgi:amino acid transporter